MNRSDAPPRILLLEDDPVSAAFLVAALEALPAQVDLADTLASAERHADRGHALWLFDANLPDGGSATLLARWRARGLRTPALAHTADARRDELDALIDAGFAEVLLKPLTIEQLHGTVRRMLRGDAVGAMRDISTRDTSPQTTSPTTTGMPTFSGDSDSPDAIRVRGGKQPVWDDAQALRALNGNVAHVATMRSLFLQELPQVVARVAQALDSGDPDALRAELHRLQASCGFVGAARLASAVDALRATPASPDAAAQWQGAAADTLASTGH